MKRTLARESGGGDDSEIGASRRVGTGEVARVCAHTKTVALRISRRPWAGAPLVSRCPLFPGGCTPATLAHPIRGNVNAIVALTADEDD